MRIVDATNRRAIERLIATAASDDPAFERRVRSIVSAVRTGGDRALERFARRFDGADGPLEVTRGEIRAGAARVDRSVRRAIGQAADNIARVAFRQIPRHGIPVRL